MNERLKKIISRLSILSYFLITPLIAFVPLLFINIITNDLVLAVVIIISIFVLACLICFLINLITKKALNKYKTTEKYLIIDTNLKERESLEIYEPNYISKVYSFETGNFYTVALYKLEELSDFKFEIVRTNCNEKISKKYPNAIRGYYKYRRFWASEVNIFSLKGEFNVKEVK